MQRTKLTHPIFSPSAAVAFYCFCAGLYFLQFSYSISRPHALTIFYVTLCLLSFICAQFVARQFTPTRDIYAKFFPQGKSISCKPLYAIFGLSALIYAIEHLAFYRQFGTIPLLVANFEELRFEFAINGYIHLLAMLGRVCLLMITCIKLHNNDRRYRYLILCSLLTIGFDVAVGNRGTALLFLFTLTVAFSFYRNFSLKIVLFAISCLLMLGLGKTYREYAMYGESSLSSAGADWRFGDSYFSVSLYHLYMTFSNSFSVLDSYIRNLDHHYFGYFTLLLPFYTLLPGHQYELGDLQFDVLGIDFFGTLTSTMFSSPYFDFGMFGFLPVFVIGLIGGSSYLRARLFTNPLTTSFYSYFSLCLFLGLYTYPFDKFYILFNIAFLLLYFPIIRLLPRKNQS